MSTPNDWSTPGQQPPAQAPQQGYPVQYQQPWQQASVPLPPTASGPVPKKSRPFLLIALIAVGITVFDLIFTRLICGLVYLTDKHQDRLEWLSTSLGVVSLLMIVFIVATIIFGHLAVSSSRIWAGVALGLGYFLLLFYVVHVIVALVSAFIFHLDFIDQFFIWN